MHKDYPVVLINSDGEVIGAKPRGEIDKQKDSFCVVYVFLFDTHDRLALSVISNSQNLPNLFGGKYGISLATILRQGETQIQAAKRALVNEVGVDNTDLILLGESLDVISELPLRKHSVYLSRLKNGNLTVSKEFVENLEFMKLSEINQKLAADISIFAPTFTYMWNKYQHEILKT